ncbi:transposase [Corynebacterium rhinophilum]
MKLREGGRVVTTSVFLTIGVNAAGYRGLMGMQIAISESVVS